MVRKEFLSAIATILLLAAWLASPVAQAENRATKDGSKTLHKVQTNGVYSPMDINNVFNYYSNAGDGSFNPNTTSNEGFEFPIGQQDGTCIFEDGLVWTTYKNDTLLCGGSTYNHGLQAGSGTCHERPSRTHRRRHYRRHPAHSASCLPHLLRYQPSHRSYRRRRPAFLAQAPSRPPRRSRRQAPLETELRDDPHSRPIRVHPYKSAAGFVYPLSSTHYPL